ncbi:MAG TPA: hypothetical protein GXZ20_02020 [Halanaerobiaceae bacterium]|jgi:hypothetical protein|nr:hypothetical protein [Bacillota bacterium]HHU91899.1 hypothetical protein [Halanaerobiaceae bacterium]HOA40800.1 hypothetical protein [Halanaerobiales bacterium]HPZ63006.1 hypothetical protein [Halanaerobiales bacterium]HQD04185.1 hypothetical protein [Halanaerobiales bacterium]
MSHLEVISILLEHAPEKNVLDYVANKIRTNENYFSNFNKEKLMFDFLISN